MVVEDGGCALHVARTAECASAFRPYVLPDAEIAARMSESVIRPLQPHHRKAPPKITPPEIPCDGVG
jgi:hypothetical protein